MVGDWRLIAPPMVAADVGDLRACALDGQHPPVLEATAGAASWLASSARAATWPARSQVARPCAASASPATFWTTWYSPRLAWAHDG